MELKCQYCGEILKGQAKKYCNRDCKAKHYCQSKKVTKVSATKQCEVCGKEFLTDNPQRKYCSPQCKGKAYYEVSRMKHQSVCAYCGKEFNHDGSHKYCSQSCALSGTAKDLPEKELFCIDCGVKFMFKGRTRKLRCDTCIKKKAVVKEMTRRAKNDPNVQIGVGSGRHQAYKTTSYTESTKERKRLTYLNKRANSLGITIEEYRADPLKYRAVRETTGYRYRALKYFDNVCKCCGETSRSNLNVHHLDLNASNGALENLTILCNTCHKRLHKVLRLQKLDSSNMVEVRKYTERMLAGDSLVEDLKRVEESLGINKPKKATCERCGHKSFAKNTYFIQDTNNELNSNTKKSIALCAKCYSDFIKLEYSHRDESKYSSELIDMFMNSRSKTTELSGNRPGESEPKASSDGSQGQSIVGSL